MFKESDFWDPTGNLPDIQLIEKENKTVEEREKFWRKHFKKIIGIIIAFFIPLAILLVVFGINSLSWGFFPVIIYVIVIFPSIYFGLIKGLYLIKRDLIKIQIAKRKNWIYQSHKDNNLFYKYKTQFPELFELGEKNKNLEDIFWGKIPRGSKEYNFVSGIYNYSIVVSSGKSRREIKYSDHFFIFKLPKKINSRFHLFPKGFLNFNKKISTESIEFNKLFDFSFKKNGSETELNIMSVLSPSVIEKLVEFCKANKVSLIKNKSRLDGVEVLFSEDFVFFMAPGTLIKDLKVKLSTKSLDFSETDLYNVEKELNSYLDLALDIYRHLH